VLEPEQRESVSTIGYALSKHLHLIVWGGILGVILKKVGLPSIEAPVGEGLQKNLLRFYFRKWREVCFGFL
jgi:hypothetical protein